LSFLEIVILEIVILEIVILEIVILEIVILSEAKNLLFALSEKQILRFAQNDKIRIISDG
jgi:hypothetical protein